MSRVPLLLRLLVGIIAGALIGVVSASAGFDTPVRVFATFTSLFGALLSFAIPLIIFGFIAPGIGSLTQGAGKWLGLAVGVAYTSSVLAGLLAMATALTIYPSILGDVALSTVTNPEEGLVEPYLTLALDPPFTVTAALVLAFIFGIGMSTLKDKTVQNLTEDFKTIIQGLLNHVIIPLLPIHVAGVFANMAYAGHVATIFSVFGKVLLMVLLLHVVALATQYLVAGTISRTNPLSMIKTMLPAYFTAIGTQSSAATIPVTLRQAKKAGLRPNIADFAIPLNANIHLSGSMITVTSCAIAVLTMAEGHEPSAIRFFPVILGLGVMMVAAPGVPGGAVVTAIGLLQSMLGFDDTMIALMIALYLAQDSFGTATNVTGDMAISKIVETIGDRLIGGNTETHDAEPPVTTVSTQ
ncbi:dicarboxylate/amino acid:cation symporter [Stomatohabitans albus]|uniref:dicarboxylate/amino acid:cation symporter n=1 Tax=Stomatohabitans albus TaxID=3110766 RepID=UPI00300CC99D